MERGTICVNILPKDAILKCGQCRYRTQDPWIVSPTPYHFTEAGGHKKSKFRSRIGEWMAMSIKKFDEVQGALNHKMCTGYPNNFKGVSIMIHNSWQVIFLIGNECQKILCCL